MELFIYALHDHFVQYAKYRRKVIYGQQIVNLLKSEIHDMLSLTRVMICDCRNNIEGGQNNFLNIMSRFLSQNTLWIGYQLFIDDLQQYRIRWI
jgi:putative transposase